MELASSFAELVRTKLKAEFCRINLAATRIVLVDMAPRPLGIFASDLSEAANRRLENLGVEVRSGHSVDQIDADGVVVGGERIARKVVICSAGVAPSPAGKWLNWRRTAPVMFAFKLMFPDTDRISESLQNRRKLCKLLMPKITMRDSRCDNQDVVTGRSVFTRTNRYCTGAQRARAKRHGNQTGRHSFVRVAWRCYQPTHSSDAPDNQEYDHNEKNDSQASGRGIAPLPTVRPARQRTDQC